ncbi:hypothetical protein BJ138DRAFT_1165276 [Hygrophoropsis aurantiaca]|uniref:Uncharacterized protein n=1 Tax=Hygrophoropsis aurantiaca TaxID=72124 RepID=A0ACB7ZVF7_9AGAM|nr:hypothetical protein BJ138DRAFT_1165276 [Hygrophoropsis aurantiaca]
MSRLLARPKRHAKKTTPAPENIEMDPRPNPRHRARNSSPHTRPRRQHQSEVVNVAAGRLDQVCRARNLLITDIDDDDLDSCSDWQRRRTNGQTRSTGSIISVSACAVRGTRPSQNRTRSVDGVVELELELEPWVLLGRVLAPVRGISTRIISIDLFTSHILHLAVLGAV